MKAPKGITCQTLQWVALQGNSSGGGCVPAACNIEVNCLSQVFQQAKCSLPEWDTSGAGKDLWGVAQNIALSTLPALF